MMAIHVFDLDGGRTCLDFANTLSQTSGEHLASYADLVAFAAQSQLITPDDADWLRAEAERDAPRALAVLVRARRLRAAIYAIFSAVAAGRTPADADLEALNAELGMALQHARVDLGRPRGLSSSSAKDAHGDARRFFSSEEKQNTGDERKFLALGEKQNTGDEGKSPALEENQNADGSYRWEWSGRELATPLWGIARSAADVLTSEADRGRVRECGSDNCRWLFVDTTRNRSRQWCSMQSCGNRQKARRHYQKVRAKQSAN
jgi:predicted RNA-binding Zn ribbon-like protein